ncbi:MAG: pyridoxal-dependent decarboxylase, partial [Pseudoruegeria sp.]
MATGKLDPKDWTGFRADAHKMLDAALDKLEKAEEGRVWTPLPDAKKAELNIKVPEIGKSPSEVRDALEGMLPYGVGNTHPRFWGWVHGTGTASGLMSDIATSVINANLGRRDHGGIHVEKSVLRWCKEMMGFPASAGGLLTSGTSMATVIAVKCARETALGFDIRKKGLSELDLVGYCSEQTHSCVARAFDLLGLGSDRLRQIPCNDAFQMDLGALEAAMTKDRAAGLRPFFVTGTAGAVNVGAIDDLEALADLC